MRRTDSLGLTSLWHILREEPWVICVYQNTHPIDEPVVVHASRRLPNNLHTQEHIPDSPTYRCSKTSTADWPPNPSNARFSPGRTNYVCTPSFTHLAVLVFRDLTLVLTHFFQQSGFTPSLHLFSKDDPFLRHFVMYLMMWPQR